MDIIYGSPMKGRVLGDVIGLITAAGLTYDESVDFTVAVYDGDIAATGSMSGNVLKCLAVAGSRQGEGLLAVVVTELINNAFSKGKTHLFLYTKPENRSIFRELGFYPIAETSDVLLMENVRNGIFDFVTSLKNTETTGRDGVNGIKGAIVANCNPITNGHLYLIEHAAKQCELLHLFILSEDKSFFPADVRFDLVKTAVSHLTNVAVHRTGSYLVSSATFPTYFLKEKATADQVFCELDLTVFRDYFAKPLNITKRFVGTEPNCRVTAAYNERMKEFFCDTDVDVVEIGRFESDGLPISASLVRKLIAENNIEAIKPIVPPNVYEYLRSKYGNRC